VPESKICGLTAGCPYFSDHKNYGIVKGEADADKVKKSTYLLSLLASIRSSDWECQFSKRDHIVAQIGAGKCDSSSAAYALFGWNKVSLYLSFK
jgi:hypothetical protein